MILVDDLLDAKSTCFEKIAYMAHEKTLTCVHFQTIKNTNFLQIFISNGEDYARYICPDFNQEVDFKITWEAFKQICFLFQDYKTIDLKIKDNHVLFFNDKCQYITPFATLYIKNHSYNFDFNEAKIISMDDCNILKEHLDFAKFAINRDNLISCDGNAVILNKLNANFNEEIYQFINPFPAGSWFFNPKQKIIVRTDKKVSCSYKYATGKYPLQAVYSTLNQHTDNFFTCDKKQWQEAIKQCVKLSDKITIFFNKKVIELMSINDKDQAVRIEVPAIFSKLPQRHTINVRHKYLILLNIAATKDKITVNFNDTDDNYLLLAKNQTKTVLIMGCK